MPAANQSARDHALTWDRLGIALSGACVVHCLWMPVMLATLPLWPGMTHLHAWAHPAIALGLFPVTGLAVRSAMRRSRAVPALLGAGLALVALAFALHGIFGDGVEASLTLSGSVLLIGGHTLNWRTRQVACAAC